MGPMKGYRAFPTIQQISIWIEKKYEKKNIQVY